MTNPFDEAGAAIQVLVNEEHQHSLWPASAAAPAGWRVAYGPGERAECLDYVTAHWRDLRPGNLVTRLGGPDPPPFRDLAVDHVEFYVRDLPAAVRWLVDGYGFGVCARSGWPDGAEGSDSGSGARSVALARGRIRLVLTEPRTEQHPATSYLDRHGDGVAGIALRVVDAAAAFDEAVRRGARPLSTPRRAGGCVTAAVAALGDVVHRLVQRPSSEHGWSLPGLQPASASGAPGPAAGVSEVDHFAVCLEPGQLDPVVEFYQRVFDLEVVFTELIRVGSQAMRSKVVQSASRAVTLTLIEPDPASDPGQIDGFLKQHGGAGVQHVAFATDDIVATVGAARSAGVEFLDAPEAYYELLPHRLTLTRHSAGALRELGVLVDEDHDGQLFQIFARSVHPRRTFFLEVIERRGARTFGSGNIKALYEAVERQRRAGGR